MRDFGKKKKRKKKNILEQKGKKYSACRANITFFVKLIPGIIMEYIFDKTFYLLFVVYNYKLLRVSIHLHSLYAIELAILTKYFFIILTTFLPAVLKLFKIYIMYANVDALLRGSSSIILQTEPFWFAQCDTTYVGPGGVFFETNFETNQRNIDSL